MSKREDVEAKMSKRRCRSEDVEAECPYEAQSSIGLHTDVRGLKRSLATNTVTAQGRALRG
jgi:hypothetical protein